MTLLRTPLPVPHGFTTREGGVSEGPFRSLNLSAATGDDPERVAENQRRVLAAFGHPPVAGARRGRVAGAVAPTQPERADPEDQQRGQRAEERVDVRHRGPPDNPGAVAGAGQIAAADDGGESGGGESGGGAAR